MSCTRVTTNDEDESAHNVMTVQVGSCHEITVATHSSSICLLFLLITFLLLSHSIRNLVLLNLGQGSENPGFLKKPNHWIFRIFYLNEQLVNLLVDLAHQLNFYLDSLVLQIT